MQDEQAPDDATSAGMTRHIGNVTSEEGFRISMKADPGFDFGVCSTIKATVRMMINGHKRWATVFVSKSLARCGFAKAANIFTFNEVGNRGFQKEPMRFGTSSEGAREGIIKEEIQRGKYEKRKKKDIDGNSHRTYRPGFRPPEPEEGGKYWYVEFRYQLQKPSADPLSLTPPEHHGLPAPGFVFSSTESVISPVWKNSPIVHLRSGPVDNGFKRGAQAELLRRLNERNKIRKQQPKRRPDMRANASSTPVASTALTSRVMSSMEPSSPGFWEEHEDPPTAVKSEADAQTPAQVIIITDDEDDEEEDLELDLREIRILRELRRIRRRKNTGA